MRSPEKIRLEELGIGRLFYEMRDALIVAELRSQRIVHWNPAASETFGYSEDEAVGRLIETLVPDAFKDLHRRGVARYVETGRGQLVDSRKAIELRALHKSGTELDIELTFAPIPDAPAEGRYMAAFIRDISERKKLERELQRAVETQRQAADRLRELDQLKNEFVAMVAHDLRSPMTVIAGFADAMRRKWDELPDARKLDFLEHIYEKVTALSELIEDVLQVARIESDEYSYEIERFDLGSLVERTAYELATTQAPGRIEVEVEPNLPLAVGDEQRNWQVLTNLITNALKFSPGEKKVRVAVQRAGMMLQVSVEDRGRGIAAEDMPKLFQKFARLTQPGRSKIKGTGLGLYICKRIVEAQGGQIWAESTPGEGSTFHYTLRAADRAR